MINEIPRIHVVELEGIRTSIQHMFMTKNDELNNFICDELDKTLSAEWIKESIRVEIEKIVKESILNIKGNFLLKQAITDSISKNLIKIFNYNRSVPALEPEIALAENSGIEPNGPGMTDAEK